MSAVVKKLTGKDVSDYDIHIQFVDTHGVDGDSANIYIARPSFPRLRTFRFARTWP